MSLVCFGEVLIDFLSDGKQPESFTKYAGGAPANVAVAATKLGLPSSFCGMLGQDMFGDFLKKELTSLGVNTQYCLFTDKAKTALAFVSLDDNGERSFSFYRPPAADLLFKVDDFQHSMFTKHSILHVCSNSLTERSIYQSTIYALTQAKKADMICSFDMNLRENLWPTLRHANERIWHVISLCDIVKLSKEELVFLNKKSHPDADICTTITAVLDANVACLLVTDGGANINYYTQTYHAKVLPPSTKVVDTTAAGDAFIGGFLSRIALRCDNNKQLKSLVAQQVAIESAIKFAAKAGAHAVSQYGAFSSLPTEQDII